MLGEAMKGVDPQIVACFCSSRPLLILHRPKDLDFNAVRAACGPRLLVRPFKQAAVESDSLIDTISALRAA